MDPLRALQRIEHSAVDGAHLHFCVAFADLVEQPVEPCRDLGAWCPRRSIHSRTVGSDGSADTGGHILAGPHDPGWGSADVGWQAAEALVAQTRQTQETTAAGLPKRVPKSNLVPGSAAPRSQSPAPVKPAAPRSADAVRGRMSNFQSGVRRGRHAKAEPVSTEPPRSTQSRPEEQE